MTPIERTIVQLERWLVAVDRERDQHARRLASRVPLQEIERAFILERLKFLDAERADTVTLLRAQEAIRQKAQLLLSHRPRMLRVVRRSQVRKAG